MGFDPIAILFGHGSSTIFDAVLTAQGEVLPGGVPTDASLSISHQRSSEVTEHQVESGSTVSDHVILKSDRVSVRGVITDSPIRFLSGIRSLVDGAGSRSQSAFDALNDMVAKRQPIVFVTRRRTYRNMILTKFNPVDDADNVESLRFTAELKQIRIVSSATVDITLPNRAVSVADRGQNTNNVGSQQPPTPSVDAVQKGSLLVEGLKSLGVLN